jgi:hypothetical protein
MEHMTHGHKIMGLNLPSASEEKNGKKDRTLSSEFGQWQ